MTVTLTIPDELAVRLQNLATAHRQSVEDYTFALLDEALSLSDSTNGNYWPTPEEVVARIKSRPPNPQMIRPAIGSLGEYLATSIASEDPNEEFDLAEWQRQWDAVEAKMKAIERANDLAEGLI